MREVIDRLRGMVGRPLASATLRQRGDVDCAVVSQVMHAYLDGELDERDEPLVRAHLDDCGHCGLDAEVHRAVMARLAQVRQSADPKALDRLHDFAEKLVQGGGARPSA